MTVDPSDLTTKEDLRDLRDTLMAQIAEGFRGVHARQDKTNGRVQSTEVEVGRQDIRIRNLTREVFRRRSDRPPDDEDGRALTRRDLRVVAGTLSAASGLVAFFWKAVPALVKVFTP